MTHAKLSLEDKYDITVAVTNMGLYADLREWDNLAALYAPKLLLDYTSLFGGEVAEIEVPSVIGMWAKQLSWWDVTQHLITNLQVREVGDEAETRAHVRAIHFKDGKPWIAGGLYTHRLRRTIDGWLICGQTFTRRYEENYQGDQSPKPAWLKAIS